MSYSWTKDLSVWIDEIDEQHRQMFSIANDLIAAINSGKEKHFIEKMLLFLENYIVSHLKSEEKCMLDSGYSDYEEHVKIHKEFVKEVLNFRKRYNVASAEEVINDVKYFIVNWLRYHICKDDRIFGEFLREKITNGETVRIDMPSPGLPPEN